MLASVAFGAGLPIMKSDRDYLLTLPINKKDLALNLHIVQIFSFLITNIILYSLLIPLTLSSGSRINYIILPINLVLLTLLTSSISVITNVLPKKIKIVLSASLIPWTLSALWGFPLTPSSIFTGNLLYGSITLLISATLSTAIAHKKLSNIEFKIMDDLIKVTSTDTKKNRTFNGASPFKAIFSLNFSALKFSEVFTKTTLRGKITNIKISRTMAISCVLATVYVLLLPNVDAFIGTIVASIFMPMGLMYVIYFSSQKGMAKERGWLAFTSMEPMLYFRYVLISKALSLITFFLPFIIANIALIFIGFQNVTSSIIALLITIPCFAVLFLYWGSITNPVQIKEETPMMPTQTNLKQMISGIPFGIVLSAIITSAIQPIIGIIAAIVLLGLTLFLLYNSYPWRIFVKRLTEKGFV